MKSDSISSVADTERRFAEIQARMRTLELRAVLLDIAEAMRQIPEKIASILAPCYSGGSVRDAPWFPGLAANAMKVVLSNSRGLRQPEDVDNAVSAYLLAVGYGARVGRAVLPLSRDKALGQRWAIDGVYDRSILGPMELR